MRQTIIYDAWQSNEINYFLAVLAILQTANTDCLLPWSFLHPHLQWHIFAMFRCGVGAWRVRRCLWTQSWRWKQGISRSGMPSFFFVLNSVTIPPQHGKLQQAFGDHAISRAQAFCWQFSEGKTLLEDDQRSRRPSTTRTGDNRELVRGLVRSDRWLTIRIFADEVNMNMETVRLIWLKNWG